MLLLLLFSLAMRPVVQDTPADMKSYQLVLLKKGPAAPPAAPADQKRMQEEHLANLAELNRTRVNLLYGPIAADAELRGIAVLDVADAEAARHAFAEDPFVKARIMTVEVRRWLGPKNEFQLPASYDVTNPANFDPLVLGFLVRGPNPDPDAASAQQTRREHLSYMDALHKQGKLVVSGPFPDDAAARGLVVYRVKDVAEAKALAAADPAVKAGHLVLEAYPWMTFKGILK